MDIPSRVFQLLLALVFVVSCGKDEDTEGLLKLSLDSQYALDVPEPSGLSFSRNKTFLYTVSDQTGKIYKISFEGELMSTLGFIGSDLEGITVNPKDGQIWVVEERNRKMIQLSASGSELNSFSINVEQHEMNSGLEGITFNGNNEHFYLLNEKIPGKLIETNKQGVIFTETNLNFASDFSGVFYDDLEDFLWIVSDEAKIVSKCFLDGTLIESYKLPISSAEGIVVKSSEKKIFIVSDASEKLLVFSYE
jgi:uncharacterized protein YjiK